ncbi:MAG: class I SAM-dependent methyltransferase [Chloroflexi bacterium]|nr:class I SAM-dependent methyltransferase [Chloroflexota bacterium]
MLNPSSLALILEILEILAVLAAIGALLYWLLVVTEGAYFGRRVVVFLYDRFAARYDGVKQYDPRSDAFHLTAPLLAHNRTGRVLDVATGTGRLPAALMAASSFRGRVDAVDASAAMLAIARKKFHAEIRVRLHRADAAHLPFPDSTFTAVTCLEALEFMPHRSAALAELLRVLRPGGLLLISNRIGPDAWKLPGRAITSARLATELTALGAQHLERRDWLIDYDLLMAQKPMETTSHAGDSAGPAHAAAAALH